MTECSTQLGFDFYKKSTLTVDFQGGDLSSDGGLLLVRQADERLGLLKQLAGCILDWRNPLFITHTLEDQVRQRVYQICAGYEDADDSDDLRKDPVLKIACDRLPTEEQDLASQPTITRLENRVDKHSMSAIRESFVRQFIAGYSQAPESLVLDIDGWDDETHGGQQLTFFNGYFDQHMYFPVQINEAKTGKPIVLLLRPGNSHPGKGVKVVLAWLLWRLKRAWPEVSITVRGDCGFSLPELKRVCQRLGAEYVFGIASNCVLKKKSSDLLERARLQFHRTGHKARLFDDVYYQAKSWAAPERVIMKAEWLEKGPNPRYLVTSRLDDPQWLYDQFYVQRGETCENRIKELKAGLKADRLSCHAFHANQFRLYLHQAAYWLMLEIRDAAQGTVFEKAQVSRLRDQLIKLGARVRLTARRVWVQMASACPWKEVITIVCSRLVEPLRC